jgi:hypothetical protein
LLLSGAWCLVLRSFLGWCQCPLCSQVCRRVIQCRSRPSSLAVGIGRWCLTFSMHIYTPILYDHRHTHTPCWPQCAFILQLQDHHGWRGVSAQASAGSKDPS